jgi:hypothetical protein
VVQALSIWADQPVHTHRSRGGDQGTAQLPRHVADQIGEVGVLTQ